MSHELAYLLLICGLLVVPGLLQRVRIPPPLTCIALGIVVILWLPQPAQQRARGRDSRPR